MNILAPLCQAIGFGFVYAFLEMCGIRQARSPEVQVESYVPKPQLKLDRIVNSLAECNSN